MPRNKYELMGKVVTVSEIYERVSYVPQSMTTAPPIPSPNNYQNIPKSSTITSITTRQPQTRRGWRRIKITPRAGWVIGYRTIFEGTHQPGGYSYASPDDWEPSYLEIDNIIPCYLICFWPRYGSQRVPVDAIELGGKPYPSHCPWTEEARQQLRAFSRDWPRDERGRWKG